MPAAFSALNPFLRLNRLFAQKMPYIGPTTAHQKMRTVEMGSMMRMARMGHSHSDSSELCPGQKTAPPHRRADGSPEVQANVWPVSAEPLVLPSPSSFDFNFSTPLSWIRGFVG